MGEVLGQHRCLLSTRRSLPPGYNGGQARDGVGGRHSSRAGQEGEKGPVPGTGEPRCPVQAGRLPGHGGTVFLSLFTALWAVLLLEADECPLAYR